MERLQMDKKEYLNDIKVVNDKRIADLAQMIKNIDETVNNCAVQKSNCEAEIAKLGTDNTMLDEIIAIIPDN